MELQSNIWITSAITKVLSLEKLVHMLERGNQMSLSVRLPPSDSNPQSLTSLLSFFWNLIFYT